MENWNDTKNVNLSFDITANEDAKEFFVRMYAECKNQEEAVTERIKQIFDEEIEVGGSKKDEAYNQILQVFAIGYQHGWNDLYSLHKENTKQ